MPFRLPFRLSYLLVPGLMLSVALVQMTLIRAQDLTPWKGGGFGMFSTFDSPSARTVRVVIQTPEGEAHAVNPALIYDRFRVGNMPNDAVLRDIAEKAAAQSWRVYGHDEILAMRDVLPKEYQRQIRRAEVARAVSGDTAAALPDFGLLAYRDETQHIRYPGRAVPTLGARVEVWRYVYDLETHEVVGSLINSVTVPAP